MTLMEKFENELYIRSKHCINGEVPECDGSIVYGGVCHPFSINVEIFKDNVII